MSAEHDEFWAGIPEEALHPVRVPIIEAMCWIGEPLSARRLVDVLDGFSSTTETLYHLDVLTSLDVAEPMRASTEMALKQDAFDVPYFLVGREFDDEG